MDRKPVIGITMGDPNGIGPEVVVKALARGGDEYDAVVFGSRDVLNAASGLAGAFPEYKLVETSGLGMGGVAPGKVDGTAGEASLSCIRAAVAAAMSGEIDAVVTAPISKESTHLAGSPYLAPVPFRGKPNEPAYVRHTAETVAEVRGLGVEELARLTSENASRLFGLDG